jgi:transcriptional regulator with XRE-family HTH domain
LDQHPDPIMSDPQIIPGPDRPSPGETFPKQSDAGFGAGTAAPDLAANLRFAASFLPSVSRLCRDIGLNRQQVNKYLSGASRPSPYNLRRIAAYFGIEPEDLAGPRERFARIWRQRGGLPAVQRDPLRLPEHLRDAFLRSDIDAERFLGVYHCYINSFSWPGHVLRYVMRIGRAGSWIVTKSVGRYAAEPDSGERYLMKCTGVATMQAHLLTIIEQQLLGAPTLSTTMLQPTYRSDVGVLSGVCLDTPMGGARRPVASRVVFRFLGRHADLRAAMAQTAVLAPESPAIEPRIRRLLAEPLDSPDSLPAWAPTRFPR